MKLNLLCHREGQSLIEAALLLPLLITIAFNAINIGYFFYVYLNLATAPRQGAEYSIQGAATTQESKLPSADDVSTLVYEDVTGAIPSSANTPMRVCTLASGLSGSGASQVPNCNSYGVGAGTFSVLQADPEAPFLVLNRVDIQYRVAPLIPGGAFNLIMPPSLTFHRLVYMRAEN